MEFRFVEDGICVILYVVGFWSFFLFKKLTFIYNIVLMESSFVYDGIFKYNNMQVPNLNVYGCNNEISLVDKWM